ncbi:MAG: isoprenylcysteine carboxylmethyltransferase family protein [Candidatus Thorarchaeota archaeon]|nr:isoprenylcysteine carboxylmethyltransferase family protein [Candidatus Thorarchaeota archaeon]
MQFPIIEEELLFRILFIVAYALFASVRFYYRGKTIGRESEKDYTKIDKSAIMLSAAIIGYLGLVIIYIVIPDLIFWASIGLPFIVRLCGVGIAFAAIILVFTTHRLLGAQYSAKQEIQKDHALISEGIYNHIRHPMYTGFNVFDLAISLISANLLLIIFSILVALPFPWMARKEEAMLTEQFGDEYREYMTRTGRFFPTIRKKK